MRFMRLRFENEDLERKFQLNFIKQQKKDFITNHLITIVFILSLLIDQIMKQNTTMILWFTVEQIILGTTLFLTQVWPRFFNYLQYYYYLVDIILVISQFCYYQFESLEIENSDIVIYQDIILQYFLVYYTRYNFLGGCVTFVLFISSRFYIQIGDQFSLASISYLISGLLFLTDHYKQEKYRRKLFLKSQRNKQLQLLIEEFVDDQVSIIEKDQQNVRFKTIIFNKRICEEQNKFYKFLKEIKLPFQKSQLLNYLYISTKQKEILLGQYKNNTYQISYQSFFLKKQQMFLKIKLVNQQISNLVDYKELFQHIIKGLQFRSQNQYKGRQIIKQLYIKAFYYQFTKYFQYYKLELEEINYKFLKYIIAQNKLQLISKITIKSFYSDKKLLFLLIYLIKQISQNGIVNLNSEDEMIKIEFEISEKAIQNHLNQINKLLYHIGLNILEQQIAFSTKISIILVDKKGLEKFY